MLIGEYRHSIDQKGRLNFPSKLREALGETFIITKGLDNCLFVYRMAEWDKLVEQTAALPMSKARAIQRFIFASAVSVEPDKQGRVLIPQTLRDHANLIDDVTVIGVSNRAEIWNTDSWNASNAELTSELVAEAMDELGF